MCYIFSMNKWLLCFAALFGFISVALGAFCAHLLKEKLDAHLLSVFETGVRYQMYHALAIPLAIWLSSPLSGWLFFSGIILFSGSLYLIALLGVRSLGFITPLGGLLFLAGWLALAIAAWKK
jgi:uncharacterized membrane protein YgdD (TMEM256/DUF423 family)